MKSVTASSLRPAKFDPDEIRRITARAKATGLLRDGNTPLTVEKNGAPVAAESGLRSQWMDVTPELAKKWLDNNFRNRRISDDVVASYARDMVSGVWVPTHQGVAFNDRDELIDGQHRLHAIILANVTIRMMVTFGLASKIEGREMTTMDAVDRGRTRSVADQLKIQHGLKNSPIIAAITANIANICCGERTRRLGVGQSLDIYRAYQPSIDWIVERRPTAHGLRSIGVLAGFAFALAVDKSSARVRSIFTELVAAVATAKPAGKTPASLLRVFLQSDDAKLLTRGSDRALAELVLHVIFLELSGGRVARLEQSLDGVNHFKGLQAERVEKIAAMFRVGKEA